MPAKTKISFVLTLLVAMIQASCASRDLTRGWRFVSKRIYHLASADKYSVSLDKDDSPNDRDVLRSNIAVYYIFIPTPNSAAIVIENITKDPIIFNWRLSALVDNSGITYSIAFPDPFLVSESGSMPLPEVVIAPYSKRMLPIIPLRGLMNSVRKKESAVDSSHILSNTEDFFPFDRNVRFSGGILFFLEFRGERIGYHVVLEAFPPGSSATSGPAP